jgi:hypothetical protein
MWAGTGFTCSARLRQPTVVLEPGLGEASSVMGWIAPAVTADSRVCVYDRVGRGWSEPPPVRWKGSKGRRPAHAGGTGYTCQGPTSWPVTRSAACTYSPSPLITPDEVAGMVLLDSTAPDGSAQAPSTDPGSYDLPGRFSALRPTWAWLVECDQHQIPPSLHWNVHRTEPPSRSTATTA